MTIIRWLGGSLVLSMVWLTPVYAGIFDQDGMVNNQVEDAPDWEELQAKLPAAPKDENLVPFYVSGIAGNQYAIDKSTLDVGKDGVVRYVLVIKSQGGAKNISFEGIRCETRERKIYATGREDGSWARATNSRWQGIAGRSLLSYHRALADEYFCPVGTVVWSKEQALQNIKAGW
ncbi:MAG: CNP1-like family protein [Sulfuriferula sp.]